MFPPFCPPKLIGQRFAAVYVEVVHHEVNRFCSRVLLHDVPTMRANSAPERLGVALVKWPAFGSTTPNTSLYRTVHTHCPAWPVFQAWPVSAAARHRAARSVSHPSKRRVGPDHRASHRCPAYLPSFRCIPESVRPRTTFFSRHGFNYWLCCKTRIVSRPTLGTSLRLTASSTIKRTVQRARPS